MAPDMTTSRTESRTRWLALLRLPADASQDVPHGDQQTVKPEEELVCAGNQ
jgi:hypothetical protein